MRRRATNSVVPAGAAKRMEPGPGPHTAHCRPWLPDRAPRVRDDGGGASAYYKPMSNLPPVRPITLPEIEAARERIRGTALRTPLVKLDLGPGAPDIRLKLENLQPTNAYKIRGAANAVAMLSEAEREKGVWTISAGNAGQGVAYAARAAGVPCSVVVIDTAPATKVERMKALGATLVMTPFDVCWRALEEHTFPGMEGTLVHPFDDHNFIAGHGSMGLEILEDCPDVRAVVAAVGGGGLIAGVGGAIKAKKP